jgi:hypothetical protein
MMPKVRTLLGVASVVIVLLSFVKADALRTSEQEGTLVVFVKWGDLNHSAAQNVYVEARGFVVSQRIEKSFVLVSSGVAGRYEGHVPAGIYNVFVSDESSYPQCKRLVIKDGRVNTWAVNLAFDNVNSEK